MMKSTVTIQTRSDARFAAPSALYGKKRVQPEGHSSASTGRFILVIDNSPTIQKVVEMTLMREGYEIRSFRDGIDAMRWFSAPEARTPDLMLVERDLPKMDGYEVIQKFKAQPRFAHTACILLSQHTNKADQLTEQRAVASLHKPFTTQELLATVSLYVTHT
jgi:chemosensory pili system protein ChpA (sensor histidine kinase/response regulator)